MKRCKQLLLVLILSLTWSSILISQTLKDERKITSLSKDGQDFSVYQVRFSKGKRKPEKLYEKIHKAGQTIIGTNDNNPRVFSLTYTDLDIGDVNLFRTKARKKLINEKYDATGLDVASALSYYIDGEDLVIVQYLQHLESLTTDYNDCTRCDESVISIDIDGNGQNTIKFYLQVDEDRKNEMYSKGVEIYLNEKRIYPENLLKDFFHKNGIFIYRISLMELGLLSKISSEMNLNFCHDYEFKSKYTVASYGTKIKYHDDYSINPITDEIEFVGDTDGWQKKKRNWWSSTSKLLKGKGIKITIPESLVSKVNERYNDDQYRKKLPSSLALHPVIFRIKKGEMSYFVQFLEEGKLIYTSWSKDYPTANGYINLMSDRDYYKKNYRYSGNYKTINDIVELDLGNEKIEIDLNNLPKDLTSLDEDFMKIDISEKWFYGTSDDENYFVAIYKNGNICEGQFKDGVISGKGYGVYNDGKWWYKGHYKDGKRHGYGKTTQLGGLFGLEKESGEYIDGVYQRTIYEVEKVPCEFVVDKEWGNMFKFKWVKCYKEGVLCNKASVQKYSKKSGEIAYEGAMMTGLDSYSDALRDVKDYLIIKCDCSN